MQMTPELLARIDGIIDETVAEALEVQRREYKAQAEKEHRRAEKTQLRLERSRNFWRSTAVISCVALAAGVCTEIVIFNRK
jgi:hypothetical protein